MMEPAGRFFEYKTTTNTQHGNKSENFWTARATATRQPASFPLLDESGRRSALVQ
jgi:hypothetical protein